MNRKQFLRCLVALPAALKIFAKATPAALPPAAPDPVLDYWKSKPWEKYATVVSTPYEWKSLYCPITYSGLESKVIDQMIEL